MNKINCPIEFYPLFQKLNTPLKVQRYMKERLTYHHQDTVKSFPYIIRDHTADCFEGGIGFAYPILYYWGYNPSVVMLHADHKRDFDHTLIIYRKNNKIGSIAKSSFPTLMDRKPVYSTLHELIDTYYPYYLSFSLFNF